MRMTLFEVNPYLSLEGAVWVLLLSLNGERRQTLACD
jgi:hypothetical protein